MDDMQEFYLCMESDTTKFYEFCSIIEKIFPELEKQKLLIDFDTSRIQSYKSKEKNVTVINDVEDDFIYARADFELGKYIDTL